jgi:hypothetical protein
MHTEVYLATKLPIRTIDSRILAPAIMLGAEIIEDPNPLAPSKRVGTKHTTTVKWSVITAGKWGIIQIIVPDECKYLPCKS